MTDLGSRQLFESDEQKILKELDAEYTKQCEAAGVVFSRYDFALEWLGQCIIEYGCLSKEYVLAASRLQEYTLTADRPATDTPSFAALINLLRTLPGDSPERWELGDAVTCDDRSGLIASLSRLNESSTILDPACGCGLLLNAVLNEIPYSSAIGISGDPRLSKVASAVLHDKDNLEILDFDSKGRVDSETYDLIISDPPLTGWRLSKQAQFSSCKRYPRWKSTHALAVWASEHLSLDGTAMICVDTSFFWGKDSDIIHRHIISNGCRIKAALYFTPSVFSSSQPPGPKADSCVVVIEKGSQQKLFVGDAQYRNSGLIENFRKFQGGKNPSLGRLCELTEFNSLERIIAQDNLKRLGSKSGFSPYSADEIFTSVAPPPWKWNQETDYTDYEDTLVRFNPTSRKFYFGPFFSSRTDWILAINPELVNMRFLVHWFNTTELGRITLDSAQRGDTKGNSVDVRHLVKHVKFYLPSKDKQEALLDSLDKLEKMKSELHDLSSNLIAVRNDDLQSTLDKVRLIRIEDEFFDWVDTLPYPLASILWRHQAAIADGREKDQFRTLIHFFEALAALIATVHLSAHSRRTTIWPNTAINLVKSAKLTQPLLHMINFGDWIRIGEFFSKFNNDLLKMTNGSDVIRSTYGVAECDFIQSLGSKRLTSMLQRTNKIRNDYVGHAGVVGIQTAKRLHSELLDFVFTTRAIFGRRWLCYELIQPATSTSDSSGEDTYICSRLTGRLNPFSRVKVTTHEHLKAGQLYLYNSTSRQALALLPFVRVPPLHESTRPGFYFYSHQKKGEIRYISYDNEEVDDFRKQDAGDFVGRLFESL